jgi:methyltransferase (TIGR00027 family)
MEEGRPSATAIGTAMARAAHLFLDDDPKIFHDPLALRLSGAESEAALQTAIGEFVNELTQKYTAELAQALFKDLRVMVTMRQKYTEEELGKAVESGVTQYVILGAGLDSFAYRRPDLASRVRVFEVDHPATQQWKRARLQELHLPLPSNLTFVPVDFEQHTLADQLRASGHRSELPTFVSWLGVTMYLTEAAVFETLRYAASFAPGSEIVFQYLLPVSLLNAKDQQLQAIHTAGVAARGEPFVSFFEPTDLAARVRALGFTQVWDLSPEDANARYFAGRTDGLRASGLSHYMKARVGSAS